MLFLGGLPLRGATGRNLFLGEFPLRGAARLKDGERRLFLGELPLRGAAQLREGEGTFWASCRCAELLD